MVRRVALLIVASIVSLASHAAAQVETVANFNPTLLETPENIAIDHDNNKYVSLALTGEIRKIAPDGAQSTFALLPLGAPPLTFCGPHRHHLRRARQSLRQSRLLRSGQPRHLEDPVRRTAGDAHRGTPDGVAAERHRASPRSGLRRRLCGRRHLARG
jgi:hypothetical protein